MTIEKAQDESMRRDGFSTVGAAANIDFPGMFTNVIEEEDARYDGCLCCCCCHFTGLRQYENTMI